MAPTEADGRVVIRLVDALWKGLAMGVRGTADRWWEPSASSALRQHFGLTRAACRRYRATDPIQVLRSGHLLVRSFALDAVGTVDPTSRRDVVCGRGDDGDWHIDGLAQGATEEVVGLIRFQLPAAHSDARN